MGALFVARTVAALLALGTVGGAVAAADPSPGRLRRAIERILARPALAHASFGIEVRSLDTGRVLFAHDASKSMRPASTLKLVTTAAALDTLGPEHRIRTTLETAGRQDALGRILGDVYLVGRGDPSLSTRVLPGRAGAAFETMAHALLAAGIRRIEGRLVGHEGAFSGDRRGSGRTWEDLVWGYGAEISALAWNDNVVLARLLPGERPGDPAVLEVSPTARYLPIESTVVTVEAGSAEDIVLTKEPGSARLRLDGRLPAGGRWEGRLAVEDPARYAAAALADVMEARGIRVAGGVATSSAPLPADTRVLAVFEGATLAERIRVVNKESQNLHAEMLLRLLGRHAGGEGSVEKGREAVLTVLRRLGVPTGGLCLDDGSGLARSDLLTARGLVALVAAMDAHPHAAAFRESLAVAGVDGTLEERMKGTPAAGRVTAKTGTSRHTNGLVGIAQRERGGRLAFAVLVNNHADLASEATDAIDAIANALVTTR